MIRVVVADDHPVVREGLRSLLSRHGDIKLVGEATCGLELLAFVEDHPVDVVLLDIAMPGPPFLELVRRLTTECEDLLVLVLSARSEGLYGVRAFQAGASGFISKDRMGEELASAIRRVAAGGTHTSQALADRLVARLQEDVQQPRHEALSDREFEVLMAWVEGKPVKVVARELGISPKTVSTYRRRIREKLGADTQADVLRYAIHHGIEER